MIEWPSKSTASIAAQVLRCLRDGLPIWVALLPPNATAGRLGSKLCQPALPPHDPPATRLEHDQPVVITVTGTWNLRSTW
jgi:hypothetical protein